ncbi:MAG: hypothetical protein Q8S03_12940 [Brevundimonas sp.]|uniref:hypothetical protein n=1 Tax=Brevundimonas sp. TaxID=1871086 RepID=UPI002732D9CF|nr:hypothetical protein [Brevundimonas sp.]MDP3405594.1 hypothetical protein [Brevundimonas sp.]
MQVGPITYLAPTPAGRFVDDSVEPPAWRRWNQTDQERVRALLRSTVRESAVIEISDDEGNFSVLPLTASFRRGRYRVTYFYYKARAERCSSNPSHGTIYSGVGVRVTANIVTSRNGVSIGDLMGLSAGFANNRANGNIEIEAIGIGSEGTSIGPYLSASGNLSIEGIRRAVESFGVVKAVSETQGIVLEPHHLWIQAADSAGCLAHRASLDMATQPPTPPPPTP